MKKLHSFKYPINNPQLFQILDKLNLYDNYTYMLKPANIPYPILDDRIIFIPKEILPHKLYIQKQGDIYSIVDSF